MGLQVTRQMLSLFPIPPTCAPQGVPGPLLGGCRLDVFLTWALWSGEELGVRGHLQAWAAFGLAR